MNHKLHITFGLAFLMASGAQAAPALEKVPLVKLDKDKAKIVVLSEIDIPAKSGVLYFQNGKRVAKSELKKADPFCSLHVGERTGELPEGSQMPLVGGSYYQSYLSSFMLYTRVNESQVGQIYCEKPSPKNYLDKSLQFSVKDFNEVFADLLKIET